MMNVTGLLSNCIVLRIISYRILAIVITSVIVGMKTSLIIHLILTVVHYLHDKMWHVMAQGGHK